jgi:DNA-binding NarL/FixJ family response regulator
MKQAESTRILAQRPARSVRPHTAAAPGATHPVRGVVVGGQRLFREALRALLADEGAVAIVGEAADGVEGIALIRRLKPPLVLLDLAMAEMDQAQLIAHIKRDSPDSKILLIVPDEDDARVCRALEAGANGYVSKNASISDLRNAVQGVVRGEWWVERRLIAGILNGKQRAPIAVSGRSGGSLTGREREVLRSLTTGGTNKDIARTLSISEKTVKTHLNNIFRKLNVARRLEAVVLAIRQGLR